MKIVRLTAENVKRIKAVEIQPSGPVQIIAGRNAQGKSSILDSIWLALGGGAAAKATKKPIRDGEDSAYVQLDLGDMVVTRTWTNDGKPTKLTVESKDGARYGSPQSMLDALVGKLSFDPLAFIQQSDKEQVETLLGLVSLPFDINALDLQRQSIYETRRFTGQQRDSAKGALASMQVPADGSPVAEVSSASIIAEYESAQNAMRDREDVLREEASAEGEHANAVAALRDAQERFDASNLYWAKAKEAVAALGDAPDLDAIRERLSSVEDVNAGARAAAKYRSAKEQVAALDAEYREATVAIEKIDKAKADGLAAAKFPIEGLSFAGGGVTYGGIPFSQSSSAEQLRVSLAMAMAMSPDLRVIRITDGSLLDSENMALIEEMAVAHDFQIWIERVDESGAVGVVIEDGQVSEVLDA